ETLSAGEGRIAVVAARAAVGGVAREIDLAAICCVAVAVAESGKAQDRTSAARADAERVRRRLALIAAGAAVGCIVREVALAAVCGVAVAVGKAGGTAGPASAVDAIGGRARTGIAARAAVGGACGEVCLAGIRGVAVAVSETRVAQEGARAIAA